MAHKQLNVRLPAALVDALRAEAASNGITLNALVERRLTGQLAPTSSSGLVLAADLANQLAGLPQQLAAITRRLDALEARPTLETAASPTRAKPVPPSEPAGIPPMGDAPEATITTAELAERTGTNRAGWNNWASRNEPGAVRDHPQAGAWRLVGRAATAAGGPPRLLWEPA